MIRAYQYQEGLIKLPVYDATSLAKGQPVMWGMDGGAYAGAAINTLITIAGDDPVDIFAVLAEEPSIVTTTNRNTPLINQAICQMVENHKVWKVYYDMAAGHDLSVTSSTASIITHGAGDQDGDGGWIYINTGTGAGQLRYVSAADATHKTVNTAFTTTPDATSDFLWLRCEGIHIGGHDLGDPLSLLDSVLLAGGREILLLKNFIEGPGGVQELNISSEVNNELDGLNVRGVRFYAHIIFLDTTHSAAGVA